MRFRRSPRVNARIDVTNLIDVVFVTLIFFMLATTFAREGKLQITLPEAEGKARDEGERLELAVSAEGGYAVQGRVLANDRVETLMAALRDASGGDTDRVLVISADGKAPHERVVRAMDAAGRSGFHKLSIATRQPAAAP